MGISTEDDKPKIAMGYPSSMDRYNEAPQYTFHAPPPAPYPIPCGPQGYAPHPYAPTASYPFPHGYQVDPSSIPSPKPYPQQQQPYFQQHQPYNDYYYNQQPQPPYMPLVLEPNKSSSSFSRVMLVLMVFLVSSMCMMTLVMWFLFGVYTPEFEVTSLKVTNFTVTDTALTGLWDVDVAITNTNKELVMGFDRVMSSIFYKESLLGVETVKPFQVPQMQHQHLNFTMLTEQLPTERKLQSWVLPMLAQEHGGGVVYFSLRMAMKANFTTPDMAAYRQENVRVFCENLQVVFSATGEGTLSQGFGNPCLIRIDDGSFKD